MPSALQPPRFPTDLAELADAVQLCAFVKDGGVLSLNMYQRERLVRYCGRMPESKTEAWRWKLWLRALRREAAAESDPEA